MWFHLSQARDSTSSSPLTSLRYAAFLYLPRTPLHCAASCNNLPMVRFLVEHGACVFATTISDHETAADKCEEDEDGYDSCSDYLYSKCGLFSYSFPCHSFLLIAPWVIRFSSYIPVKVPCVIVHVFLCLHMIVYVWLGVCFLGAWMFISVCKCCLLTYYVFMLC